MSPAARARLFLGRELALAVRARWFLVYTAVFLLGGGLLTVLGSAGSLLGDYRGYARALAGLAHFAMVFVPLMALIPACASIAEERETGTLEYVLAQPVTWPQLYSGKWGGLALAVALTLTIGYLGSAAVAVTRGVPAVLALATYGFLVLLCLAFVSLGTALSAISSTRARATTLGLVAWLVLVILGSLGAMATFIRWGIPSSVLVAWTLLNPVEAFRIGVLTILDPDLQLLGPVGIGLVRRHGPGVIASACAACLGAWILVPFVVGRNVHSLRRDGV